MKRKAGRPKVPTTRTQFAPGPGETPIKDRLQQLGADVKFLIWLEGEADRLPRLEAVRDVEGDQWAAAIRAATWLRSQSINDAWDCRYHILESFLCNALKLSGNYAVSLLEEDLAKMQTVISLLLPESATTPLPTRYSESS
jgi:hypothetical protein